MTKTSLLMEQMIELYRGDAMRIQHFIKVHAFAEMIGRKEGLEEREQEILETAALVHDIGIHKAEELYGSSAGKYQEELGPDIARELLRSLGYDEELIQRVCYLVGHHHTYHNIEGMDYQILVEADFLVNHYEDSIPAENIKITYDKIFRTKEGRRLCATIYLPELVKQ